MSDSNSKSVTVAIIGAGEMGAAVGRRLREMGARVITPLRGRSAESVERVRQARLEVVDDDTIVREAQFILSIVPPGVALAVAESLRGPLERVATKPVFAECNAVSPATARRIAAALDDTGCHFVDAGIIGGPPPMDRTKLGPRFYASGPAAQRAGAHPAGFSDAFRTATARYVSQGVSMGRRDGGDLGPCGRRGYRRAHI